MECGKGQILEVQMLLMVLVLNQSDRRNMTNELEEKGQCFAGCVEEQQQQGLSGNRSNVKTLDFTVY